MVSDGINVLSGTVPPAMRARYTRNDDGIYGCPSGSERAFTREMLNLRPLDPLEEPAPPMVATPEFLAQQRNRRSVELAEGPPDRRTAGDPAETPSQNPDDTAYTTQRKVHGSNDADAGVASGNVR